MFRGLNTQGQSTPEWEAPPDTLLQLDNLCVDWERYPDQRPHVFFTLGSVAMLSTEAGVDQAGSVCRQFWNWLGQPGYYDASTIQFSADGSGTVNMSIPNLTQFQVKNIDGPFQTTISRRLVTELDGTTVDRLQARIIMTDQYPQTEFRLMEWSTRPVGPEVLVDISGHINGRDLVLDYFMSKDGEDDSKVSLSGPEGEEERKRIKGMGRRLLCYTIRCLPSVDTVWLLGTRGYHWRRDELRQAARDMTTSSILSDLQELDPVAFAELESKLLHLKNDLARLRTEWVNIRSNHRLMEYYIKHFGFSREHQSRASYFPRLCASTTTILQHCDQRQ